MSLIEDVVQRLLDGQQYELAAETALAALKEKPTVVTSEATPAAPSGEVVVKSHKELSEMTRDEVRRFMLTEPESFTASMRQLATTEQGRKYVHGASAPTGA